MEKPWIINWKGIVEKVRDQSQLLYLRLAELVSGAYIKCPNCQYCIDCSKVPIVWPKVPVGVKFVLSDSELLLHLEEKSNQPDSVSSAHNKEFIPTIEDPDGICYTHPKNLPGIKTDGSSSYFFYRISNAYGRGHRKRRKVDVDYTVSNDTKLRWHKTGTSKEVCDENGVKKGWKKILVLYTGSKKGRDSKTNWVMHQYHLGVNEAEKNGQLVVSKVFYQLASKQVDKSEMDISVVEHDASIKIDPRTPKIDPPQPRHPNNSPCETEQYNSPCLLDQGGAESSTSNFGVKDEDKYLAWYAGSSEILEDTAQPDMGEPSVTGMHIVSESASDLGFQTFLDKGKAPLVLTQVLEPEGGPSTWFGKRGCESSVQPTLEPTLSNEVTGNCLQRPMHDGLPRATLEPTLSNEVTENCLQRPMHDGLPSEDNILPSLGPPTDYCTLADTRFGSQDNLEALLESFCTSDAETS